MIIFYLGPEEATASAEIFDKIRIREKPRRLLKGATQAVFCENGKMQKKCSKEQILVRKYQGNK